ncbi:MAG TPA: hypothetical protein VJK72_02090 [Candidatus Nanoarchaeia archaeon]|nr:hypothetical protein [Candidatus Nanoarchaeia archaeon]
MNKKGVSPLIATFMLIVLAIGLGVVVMNFGRAQIEIAAQCAVDIGLQITQLNDKPQVCFNRAKSELFFIVENGRQIPVESLKLRVIGEKAVLNQDVPESSMDRLGTLLKYIPYDIGTNGDVRQVRFTPEVTLYDEKILCSEQAIIIEDIRDCENAS